jgi:hypothetical protein
MHVDGNGAYTAALPRPRQAGSDDGIDRYQVMLTRVGLRLPDRLTFENWERAGRQLAGIVDSSAWCLGDWLVFGKQNYTDRYQRALRTAGLNYQTLRNYAWVARRFPLERRRAALSFQHHAEVASLPIEDQETWLGRAEEGAWSTKQLRVQMRDQRGDGQSSAVGPSLIPRIPVAEQLLVRWREAADRSGVQFDNWVVRTLEEAAGHALDGFASTEV